MDHAQTRSGPDAPAAGLDLHLEAGGRGVCAGLRRELRAGVASGRLKPGVRLPSSRVLAADLGVARNTVAEAYAQLVAEGWLESCHGRGTSVARDLPQATLTAGAPTPGGPLPRHDLRPGVPDVAGFPRQAWAAAYRTALLAASPEDLSYGDPRGHPRLRAALAAYLGRARGVVTTPDRVVVCNGATHGLSMLVDALARAGHHRVAVESYCFPASPQVAARRGLAVTPLPLDDEGARVGQLWNSPVGAAVLTPAHQFPSGVPLAGHRRQALLEWARGTSGLVVEDDYDGEFRYDGRRLGTLQAQDPDHVLYLGSASKALTPALRLGWMAVPTGWLGSVVEARDGTDLHPGVLEQLALAHHIESGAFDRHLRAARIRYRRRRARLEQVLAARARATQVHGVAAGLHLVVDLPGGPATERQVLARASACGVALAGLGHFRAPGAGAHERGGLVIGYARPAGHAYEAALEALLAALAAAGAG